MIALRLLWLFTRAGILSELTYRSNLAIQIVQSSIGLATALGGIAIVFSHADRLAGWRPSEIVGLLGVYFAVGGLIRMVMQPSMQRFMEEIREGTLDFTLTKPADAQVLVSVKQVEVWKLTDVVLGAGLIVASRADAASVGVAQMFGFVIALLAGCAIVYAFWLILATCTFWFVRLDNILVIFLSMWEAGRWPIGIYPPWLRYTLTFLVPVGFATTVPAEALAGRLEPVTLSLAVALAAAFLLGARWFWRIALRHYSGASA